MPFFVATSVPITVLHTVDIVRAILWSVIRVFSKHPLRVFHSIRSWNSIRLATSCLISSVLVLGCATNPPAGPALVYNSIQERQSSLLQLQDWRAKGRIALATPGDSFTASLNWQQQFQNYDVRLSVLFGQRTLRVLQQNGTATLSAPGRAAVNGVDAELLLLRELGVRVPLTQFVFWMRGLPGNVGTPSYDNNGRLQKLVYRDADGVNWNASFGRFKVVDSLELPELIDIIGGDIRIRLLINSWTFEKVVASQTLVAPQTTPAGNSGRLAIPGT